MFVYEKKLQYPVKIHTPNPRLASLIITQYGGPYANRLLLWLKRKTVGDGEGEGGFIEGAAGDDLVGGGVFLFGGGVGVGQGFENISEAELQGGDGVDGGG